MADASMNEHIRLAVSSLGQAYNFAPAGHFLLALQQGAGLVGQTPQLPTSITTVMDSARQQPGVVMVTNIPVVWMKSNQAAGTVQIQHIIAKGVNYWRIVTGDGPLQAHLTARGLLPAWFTEEYYGKPSEYVDFDPTVPDEIPSRFKWWYVVLAVIVILLVGGVILFIRSQGGG